MKPYALLKHCRIFVDFTASLEKLHATIKQDPESFDASDYAEQLAEDKDLEARRRMAVVQSLAKQ